ncbi:gamma-glutamyl-gamma-aminobutyrate hydrolase family protein [Candidatus Saccharibacteria bacterium]|nr:gamma-glutamyl-gamma-aminobutyrate hydrolase family protein [Candidatus Saccharibacteria bacterium]
MTLILDNGTRHLEELIELVGDCRVIALADWSDVDIEPGELLVLSGGHSASVVSHHEHYQRELSLISSHNGPILGICLGFELIATAFGSKLRKIESRHGLVELSAVNASAVLEGLASSQVYEAHRWSFEAVGASLMALAQSPDGIEMVRHISKPIVGVQFHPEVYENDNAGKVLYRRLLTLIGPPQG